MAPTISARILAVLAGGLWLASPAPATASAPPGYYLVWSDEFSGNSLDASKWGYWSGAYHDAVNTSSAISVSGGHLTITTYTSGGTHYTAILESRNKFHPRYGFLEASIDYGDAAGCWSAFWLQADHEDDCPFQDRFLSNPYYAGAEIDVCEHRTQDSSGNNLSGSVNTYIHWNGYSGYCGGWGTTVGPSPNPYGSGLNSGFHTYGLLWATDGSQFYIDNAWQWSTGSGNSGTPEWILLSTIVDGSSWAGSIPSGGYGALGSSTTKMVVDYVRYYAPTNQVYWAGSTSSYWTNAANWIGSRIPQPNEEVVFSTLTDANSAQLGTNFTVRKLVFLDGAGFSINGGTLALGSGGIDLPTSYNGVTLNATVSLSANQTWHVAPDRTLTMAGTLSGAGMLSKSGWGTLILSGSNSFTGTLNVDTASTSGDDGAVQIKSAAAIANVAGPIWIRNNNSGTSRLEFNGSSGTLNITKAINLAGRNSSSSAIVNVAGSNIFSGDLLLAAGGGNYWIESAGGRLSLAGALPVSTPGGARTITLLGGSPIIVTGVVQDGSGGGTVSLVKSGTGTALLTGANTFSGTVAVNEGILQLASDQVVGTSAKFVGSTTRNGGLELTHDVTIPPGITFLLSNDGVGSTVPYALRSLAGVNTIMGAIRMTSGGGYPIVTVDAGSSLNLNGPITNDTARTLLLQGAGNGNINGPVKDGLGVSSVQINGGAWTINGTNTYTGSTIIAGGRLTLGPTASLANSASISVTNGARFDVSQVAGGFVVSSNQLLSGTGVVTGNVALAAGGRLGPGSGIGTLSLSNNLTVSGGATLEFKVSNSTNGPNDLVVVQGNLNLSGANTIALTPVNDSLANGRYVLLRYRGARTGGAANFNVVFTTLPPATLLTVDDSVTNELAVITTVFPGSLLWQGNGTANAWDNGVSSNWLAGGTRAVFLPGDSVSFDDSSTNSVVSLVGNLAPGLVALLGSSNYTFTGTGRLSGAGGIVKSNTGTLTFLTTNNNTGAMVIAAGSVQVGNGTTSGALGSGNLIDNGALIFNHPDTQTVASVISGSGSLAKQGAGTLVLSGNNSYAGGTTVNAGIVLLNSGSGFGVGVVTLSGGVKRVVAASGAIVTNAFTLSPGAGSGTTGQGLLTGPASGAATLTGPINITASAAAGGVFDGGNTSGGLIISGPVTSSVPVVCRAGRGTFAGGGAYNLFQSFGLLALGAQDGLATNAVLELGSSGATATFDLAGFNQTLNGLQKGSGSGTVGNSSTTNDVVLGIGGASSNTTYAGVIQDSLSGGTRKVGLTVKGGTFTLSGTNTFTGDTRLVGGTLVLGNASCVSASTLDLSAGDTGALSLGSLTAATCGGVKGTRLLALTNASGAAVALTVGNGHSGTNTFAGALTGSGGVTKTGAGMWILSGSNSFTGALNVDTAQGATGNDGVLRLSSSGAAGNASGIFIRNQNSATSTLQLDGGAGGLAINRNVTLNGRNNAVPAIQNVAGDNTLSGNITLGAGGATYTFQSDGGTLTFGGVVGIHSLSSGRLLSFQGAGNLVVSGSITNGFSGTTNANSVVKSGVGTLTLAGSNTYTGTTTVSDGTLVVNGTLGTNLVTVAGGTLGGSGVLRGSLTVSPNATLAPGASMGTLTVSNTVTLAGLTRMEINRDATPNSDRLACGSIVFSGDLVVLNVGGYLQVNDTFKLFDWTGSRSGSFNRVTLPAGYTWDTSQLEAGGTISVAAVEPPPTLNVTPNGGGLEFSWTGSFTYKLQTQARSLDAGLLPDSSAWQDWPGGDYSPVTVPMDPGQPAIFFRLVRIP